MLSLTRRARLQRSAIRIQPFFLEDRWGKSSQEPYEIPLIELIIRKKMAHQARERAIIAHGNYSYKPSQSYFNFVSKFYSHKKKK